MHGKILFHLLTVELLMGQLVQSFRTQTPTCLDQFLPIGKEKAVTNAIEMEDI